MRLYLSRTEQYAVAILLFAMLGALAVLSYAYGKKHLDREPGGPPPLLEQRQEASPASSPAPPTAEVVVHVAGAVKQSGIYTLSPRSRINDAIRMAGGAREDGYPDALNLAAPLADGQRIWVPTRAEWEKAQGGEGAREWVTTPTSAAPRAPAAAGTSEAAAPDRTSGPKVNPTGKVPLNTATADELMRIVGIGPVTAKHIIDYREAHGPFTDLAQLLNVQGIGPKTFEKISPYLSL